MSQVKCEVKGVFVTATETATVPLVILSDRADRLLPIFIGLWEAVSINSAKNHEVLPRPFTHDLFIDMMGKFSISFSSLQIDSVQDGVYYAQLVMNDESRREYIDCRPSDGLILAARQAVPAPMLADQRLLAQGGDVA